MADYRVYFLTSDNHIQKRRDYEFADDDTARATVTKLAGDAPIEMWQSRRVVLRAAQASFDSEAQDLNCCDEITSER